VGRLAPDRLRWLFGLTASDPAYDLRGDAVNLGTTATYLAPSCQLLRAANVDPMVGLEIRVIGGVPGLGDDNRIANRNLEAFPSSNASIFRTNVIED